MLPQLKTRSRPPSTRAKLAGKLIRKGMAVSNAMLKAGYSPTYSMGNTRGKTTAVLIQKEREDYIMEYFSGSRKNLMTGGNVAKRLAKTVFSDDDFNSTAAIREHNRMMQRADSVAPAVNVGVFIIPPTAPGPAWSVQSAKVIDISAKKDSANKIGKVKSGQNP